MADRPYIFYELTNSVCPHCLRKVEAKIVVQDGCVYMHKWCPAHKLMKVLISTDASYFRQQRDFLKPGQMPRRFNTPIKYGCPFDCGLCPDHEQHSCLTLLEITDMCNLRCPVCYSDSGPHRPTHRSMEQIAFMLEAIVRNEGEPDVVQISGGEPTIHPEFWQVLELAKSKAGGAIKHLMLNTNGVKIAREADFAKKLAAYMPGFEVYLQFDSLRADALVTLRGEDLREVRLRALERLNEHNVSTTLVVTLQRGVNEDQIGEIIDFALKQKCVRGVTFQPVQVAGRLDAFDPEKDRLTLSEVRRRILEQSPVFLPEDIIPVPCHPDCLAMAYALKMGEGCVTPLTRLMDPKLLLSGEGNTIVYERNKGVREQIFKAFSTGHSPGSGALALKHLLCCLPEIQVPEEIGYSNLFRVIIMKFMDAWDMDVRSVKKTCVHIAHPDGRIIPFDTFNLFYRDGREASLARQELVGMTVSGR
ncbi:MAG TPA: radical SAM protein [Phycisphaerae bacterium]|nr:radical SAM protein [Phycisphaerae bacterium]